MGSGKFLFYPWKGTGLEAPAWSPAAPAEVANRRDGVHIPLARLCGTVSTHRKGEPLFNWQKSPSVLVKSSAYQTAGLGGYSAQGSPLLTCGNAPRGLALAQRPALGKPRGGHER